MPWGKGGWTGNRPRWPLKTAVGRNCGCAGRADVHIPSTFTGSAPRRFVATISAMSAALCIAPVADASFHSAFDPSRKRSVHRSSAQTRDEFATSPCEYIGDALAAPLSLRDAGGRAPLGPRAGHLLAVNLAAFGSVQLFKLRVERMSVGADAFRSYLTGSVTP